MTEVLVIEVAPGEYSVTAPGHYQPHDPELEGFVPMSLERAEEVAAALRLALGPVPEAD